MPKPFHEIRDPVHNFIRLEAPERAILDSRPFQRLRHVHQLAMAYLLYPGATHRRFEHSLGVMELAGRVFDVVTHPNNLADDVARDLVREYQNDLPYWRRVVRLAALCHDVGHLPFSHAAERELLPEGWDHERITDEIVRSDEMTALWKGVKVDRDDVAKLALGPKKFGPRKHRIETFTPWEAVLAEIIVGDAFGVDRIDYLLRDSYHAGVAYGRFDHFRLIDTLRILPKRGTDEPALGIESGGIHSAEALLLARYFMYTQVYFRHTRRVYDFHLTEFLKSWLPGGKFGTGVEEHLRMTDNEVLAGLRLAADDPSRLGHAHARRIVRREHYRLLYQRNPDDQKVNTKAAQAVYDNAATRFGADSVHLFTYRETSRPIEFPVLMPDGRTASGLEVSGVLESIPVVSADYVFVDPQRRVEAQKWLADDRAKVIAVPEGTDQ
jgi:HD superfamily phosphohydrolase